MRVWLVVAIAACKSGSPSSGSGSAGPPPGSAASVAGSGSAVAVAIAIDAAGAPDAFVDPRCGDACLVLADTPVADAPAEFTRTCGKPWPYDAADCDDTLLELNCIYAAHGNVFKGAQWKAAFEHKPWYRPRADFKDADLGAVGTANVHALKQRHEPCTRSVSADDRTLASDTFQKMISDDGLDVPGVFTTNDAFRQQFKDLAIYTDTKLSYVPSDPGARAIRVEHLYEAVGPGRYVDAGYLVLTFDAQNRLIAVAP